MIHRRDNDFSSSLFMEGMISRNVAVSLTRLIILSLLILVAISGISQFNDRSSNIMLLGFGRKYTAHEGFLGYERLPYNANDTEEKRPKFYEETARGLSMDFRHLNFTENCVISICGESALYALGELLSPSSEPYKGAFNFLVGQQTEYLSHNQYADMKQYHTRWINRRFIEGNATFGPWDLQLGFHTSIRSLGYTNFSSFTSESIKIFETGDLVTKLLAGPAIGFRKTIDNVNVLAFGSISGSFNMKNSYRLKNSKHAEVTLFTGRRFGAFASCYARSYEGQVMRYDGISISPKFMEYTFHFGLYYGTM